MAVNYIYNLGLAFHEVAERHSERPALLMLDGTSQTYGELEVLSNQIATFLITKGIKKGDVVAIFNKKLPQTYSCMLACLKIGAVYLNVDSSSPLERVKKIIDVSQPSILWSNSEKIDELQIEVTSDIDIIDYLDPIFMNELRALSDKFPSQNHKVDGNSPAYIMFTSGSTGFPKGAVISHSNVLNFVSWSQSTFSITPEDRITNINPMHFDNSVFDFYSSIYHGAALIPVGEKLLKNPRNLLDALNSMHCTLWFSVPSLIIYILRMRALKETDLPTLRTMIFGGEGFPKNQLRVLKNILKDRIRLINVYGPTESTCICSAYEVCTNDLVSDELLPLGRIAQNYRFLVVDNNQMQINDSEVGELYLGGPNVGIGYYRDAEKTAGAFVQNPFHSDYRDIYYKTGDLVSYDVSHDSLLFCGRKDNQVKRMGYRIELEEIEYAIGALDYVVENAVVSIKTKTDIIRIIACVSSHVCDEIKLIEDLRLNLPSYMIPDRVIFMDILPKNQNGKIDRQALVEMEDI